MIKNYLSVGFITGLMMQAAWAGSLISGADDGPAIQGYDPVNYFTNSEPAVGSEKFTTQWKGAEWRFTSAEHRDLFIQNPEKYAPEYGGYCAYAVAHNGVATGDGDRWKIVDDKLYLNNNWFAQKLWLNDVPGNIEDSEENWPEVKTKIEAK